MTAPRSALRDHALAFIVMMVAAPATLGGVLALNEAQDARDEAGGRGAVDFDVERAPPKPPPPARPTPRKPKRSPRRRSNAPPPDLPDLGVALSGVELDGPTFELVPFDDPTAASLDDARPLVHTEATVDARPVLRRRTPIAIPPAARKQNLSGRVLVKLLIGVDGAVRRARVVEAEPAGVFEQPVLNAVRSWLFEPATYEGERVEMWVVLPVEFQP